jgi:hypothetical protein
MPRIESSEDPHAPLKYNAKPKKVQTDSHCECHVKREEVLSQCAIKLRLSVIEKRSVPRFDRNKTSGFSNHWCLWPKKLYNNIEIEFYGY